MKDYFMISECDGALYDTRKPDWHKKPLRENYARHYLTIENTAQLKATIRAGEYTFPGGYRLAFLASDSEWLSFDAVKENLYCVVDSMRNDIRDGWFIVGCDVVDHYDEMIHCSHTGELLNDIEE